MQHELRPQCHLESGAELLPGHAPGPRGARAGLARPAEFTASRSEGEAGKEGIEEGMGGSRDGVAGVGNTG